MNPYDTLDTTLPDALRVTIELDPEAGPWLEFHAERQGLNLAEFLHKLLAERMADLAAMEMEP